MKFFAGIKHELSALLKDAIITGKQLYYINYDEKRLAFNYIFMPKVELPLDLDLQNK